ncbi:hydrolase [Halovibrio salipaludis]|uniref:Hydrolase n=1 Tax=Halovibrio salipaludis TaxID=2032626 RepID=A0A2A2FBW9_9GAMM|nr:HAD family hydrolase [Halovibrio salipaludis]PAU82102.1 hydrolase [Halovibrio salipaludis]
MIILDIDGTLIDHVSAEERAAQQFGNVYADVIPRYSAATFPEVWREASEKHMAEFLAGEIRFAEQRARRVRTVLGDPSLSDHDVDEIFNRYLAFYEEAWELFPDVLAFLEHWSPNEYFVALSDGSQAQQERKLEKTGIRHFFQAVVTAETVGVGKPDARLFNSACDQVGVSPSEACYIGDRLDKDARGAQSAGVRGIWLNRQKARPVNDVEMIHSLSETLENRGLF